MDIREEKKGILNALPKIDREPRFNSRVVANKEVAPDVIVLTISRPEQFSFSAGQYVWIVLPEKTPQAGVVDRRAYSIASASDAVDHLEFLIRITESEYTKALKALTKDAEIQIIGPMGSQFVPPPEGAVMVAGGTGVSTFLSIIRSRAPGVLSLYFFEDPKRPLYCKEELAALASAGHCGVSITQGAFDVKKIEQVPRDLNGRPIFISGPQAFVDVVTDSLLDLGVEKDLLRYEALHPTVPGDVAPLRVLEEVNSTYEIEQKMMRPVLQDPIKRFHVQRDAINARIIDFFIFLVLFATVGSVLVVLKGGVGISLVHIVVLVVFGLLGVQRYSGNRDDVTMGKMITATVFVVLFLSRFNAFDAALLRPWTLVFPLIVYLFIESKYVLVWNIFFASTIFAFWAAQDFLGIAGVVSFGGDFAQNFSTLLFLCVGSILVAWQDIYQRQAFENHFKNQEELNDQLDDMVRVGEMFVKIANQTSNHITITDRNGRILYVNRAAEYRTGYTLPEMRGQTPRLWGGLMNPLVYKQIWDEKSHGFTVTHKILNRHKNGHLYIALGRITPIMRGSEVLAYVATEEDITDIMRLDETKSDFISTASHQLRTPLTGIAWVTERFMKKEKLTKKGHEYLQDIHESTKSLSVLVDSLLNISRIEASGDIAVVSEPFDAVEMISLLAMEMQTVCARHQVTLLTEKHPKSLPVSTDKQIFRNIVQSLLSNAIEYTPSGGRVELTLEPKGSTMRICITDTGIGIPSADRGRIFSKFYRAENAKLVKPGGTGLGLYIAKQGAGLLGGSIDFDSKIGKGTTFYLDLPIVSAAREGVKRLQG